jgi:hypothetical protein
MRVAMMSSMKRFRLLAVVGALGVAATGEAATINAASCNSAAVQTAINSALRGDTVLIPNGACTWTTGVSISGKGIIIKGQSTAGVTITNNVTADNAIRVTEDNQFHTEIAQLSIVGNSSQPAILVEPFDTPNDTGGKAVLLHDLNFSDSFGIRMKTNRGVIYSLVANNHKGTQEVVQCKPESLSYSWSTPSTMGTADTTGVSNVYVEDSTFTLVLHEAIDWDDNCRIVIRHNTFDNSSITSHGADTSAIGSRHVEIYNNIFIFTDHNDCDGSQTANLAYFIFMRGATGVIADNTGLANMHSCAWGDKPAVDMTVMNLQRSAGPNPCWGESSSGGAKYPSPRQLGFGYVTGNGRDGTGRQFDSFTYVGDSEPFYIWNQTPAVTPVRSDFGAQSGACAGAPVGYDTTSNYLVQGRDYFLGTPKPGYTKYAYPHPLRAGAGRPQAPTNLRIIR